MAKEREWRPGDGAEQMDPTAAAAEARAGSGHFTPAHRSDEEEPGFDEGYRRWRQENGTARDSDYRRWRAETGQPFSEAFLAWSAEADKTEADRSTTGGSAPGPRDQGSA